LSTDLTKENNDSNLVTSKIKLLEIM